MFRKYAVVMSLGLLLAASCCTLGGTWNRPNGMLPVTDAAADGVAGGQSYCSNLYFSATDFGCDMEGCPGYYCGPIAFLGNDIGPIYGTPEVVECLVCGVTCGYCNGITPCVVTSVVQTGL